MATKITGGCLCGAVRYECAAEPLMAVNCYCRDCQHATGAAMAPVLLLSKAAFKVTKGEFKHYEVTAASGNKVSRGFCANCGAPVLSVLSGYPDMVAVKAASLDDPAIFKPTMNCWVSSAPPWAPIARELPTYPRDPQL